MKLNTDAYIDSNATVNAAKDVTVTATGNDNAVSVVVGAGGGTVGVAGSVSVTILNTHTYASTGSSVTITAGGNVLVSATEDSKIIMVDLAVAGGFVGVGAAVGVLSGTKDTRAFVGANNTITANATSGGFANRIYDGSINGNSFGKLGSFTGVAVQAASSENIFGITFSVAGGFVGVAVGVGVTLYDVTTQATVGNGLTLTTNGGVNVTAVDYAKTLTIGGGAAGGFVGVGGGVDIGVLKVNVLAQVGTGSITASTTST